MRCREYVSKDGTGYGKHRFGFICELQKGHNGPHYPYPEAGAQGVVRSSELLAVRGQIERLNKDLEFLYTIQQESESETKIRCLGWTVGAQDGCGAEFPVKDLDYMQTVHYSCGEWTEGEGGFDCPACHVHNRFFERPEATKLKRFFKSTTKHEQ